MTHVTLDNQVEMPALGLGVFQTPPDETRAAVRAALSAGYRQPCTDTRRAPPSSASTGSTC